MSTHDRGWLAFLAALFLAWHVPLLFRTVAGHDEHWFAAAGITITRTGLPQIPYMPSRDPSQICYKSDVALYVLPPLSFYLQALVHLVLGPGLGQARLASTIEALVAAFVVYRLALLWFDDHRAALLGASAFLFSRVVLFPATLARPSMAAAMFGLLAVWSAVRYQRDRRRLTLVASGVAAGLGLLTHPVGVVSTSQVGLTLLLAPGSWRRRIGDAAIFSVAALTAFALWLPLIAVHLDLFRIQFGGNVLNRAVPGLGSTVLSPTAILAYQARLVWGHILPLQGGLYLLGYVWAFARGWRWEAGREFLFHLSASLVLLLIFMGRHPGADYFVFPAALASIAIGMLASRVAVLLEGWRRPVSAPRRAAATVLVTAVLVLTLAPGSGFRTLVAHLQRWHDPMYDARQFTRVVMADIPSDRLAAIDSELAFDAYLAGRRIYAATVYPKFFDARREPFEYAVFGRTGLELDRPQMDDLVLVRSYGDRANLFAPYAELYRREPSHRPTRPLRRD